MAAPKEIKMYLGKTLNLPHTFWGEDAKVCYPNDWKTGSQLVTLATYTPAKKDKAERLSFKADDGKMYDIVLKELQVAWRQKRFIEQGTSICYTFLVLDAVCAAAASS